MKLIVNFSVANDFSPNNFWQNRAFQYGDGLFETMLLREGEVRFLADHYQRLTEGMAVLGMEVPDGLSIAYLQQTIPQLATQNYLGLNARVKLQVWRSTGGLYTPDSQDAEFLLSVAPLPAASLPATKKRAIFYEEVRLQPSVVSRFKTCSALPYVLAGLARKRSGADDAILLDGRGHVAECVASNIFWVKEETLYTPSLESGCVEGVMRKQLLKRAASYGLELRQGLFTKSEMLEADSLFCCNAAGIQFIKQVEDRLFPEPQSEPLLRLLRELR